VLSKRFSLDKLFIRNVTVIGRCMQRHRHLEFIRFLNAVERQVVAGKVIHTVLDNYATHKHQDPGLSVLRARLHRP